MTDTAQPVPADLATAAALAYAAYGNATGGRNFLGDPMPAWGDLPEAIQRAWGAAAAAIWRYVTPANADHMDEVAQAMREGKVGPEEWTSREVRDAVQFAARHLRESVHTPMEG
ncbi:hypothetical protein [Streptomyces sp. NRRL S-350]|uniref:hypothetical protein n=1 Tax=Streptomyces sp. NRRL S-350 TaxID=1463902 RepID=UPI0004BEB81C|nr:hypothetical protein [Streptomyces sp. NRRL S-350]